MVSTASIFILPLCLVWLVSPPSRFYSCSGSVRSRGSCLVRTEWPRQVRDLYVRRVYLQARQLYVLHDDYNSAVPL